MPALISSWTNSPLTTTKSLLTTTKSPFTTQSPLRQKNAFHGTYQASYGTNSAFCGTNPPFTALSSLRQNTPSMAHLSLLWHKLAFYGTQSPCDGKRLPWHVSTSYCDYIGFMAYPSLPWHALAIERRSMNKPSTAQIMGKHDSTMACISEMIATKAERNQIPHTGIPTCCQYNGMDP